MLKLAIYYAQEIIANPNEICKDTQITFNTQERELESEDGTSTEEESSFNKPTVRKIAFSASKILLKQKEQSSLDETNQEELINSQELKEKIKAEENNIVLGDINSIYIEETTNPFSFNNEELLKKVQSNMALGSCDLHFLDGIKGLLFAGVMNDYLDEDEINNELTEKLNEENLIENSN